MTLPRNKQHVRAGARAFSSRPTLVALMALIVSAFLATVVAGPVASATAQGTPFRAEFVVTQNLTPDPLCGGLHVLAAGSGSATHLGRTNASFDECVNFLTQPGRVRVCGSGVLSAASGDQLHMTLDKTGNLPDLAGNVHVAGTYTITGGTGRFAEATGSGTTTTDTNVASPLATVKMIGTLATMPIATG